jgi:hypothetical protein
VERGQRREAVPQDVDRDAGLEPRLDGSEGQDHLLDGLEVVGGQSLAGLPECPRRENLAQVETLHQLHAHHAQSPVGEEALDHDEVLLLYGRHPRGDGGDATHVLGVSLRCGVRFG